MAKIIVGTYISEMCDYSFGDQASVLCGIPGGFMKPANSSNLEFIKKVESFPKEKKIMTLFIDNIRLYSRKIFSNNQKDQEWLDNLASENDLLNLCSKFPEIKFVIFCNLEDTPIDEKIEDRIPENVLSIFASNAVYFNDKVIPFPYGMQRKMNCNDERIEVLEKFIDQDITTSKLMFVSHNTQTNPTERGGLRELFMDKKWASAENGKIVYPEFLQKIKTHKFTLCPIGNAIDCHRNWEVLYMRRVPVMKRDKYLEKLFSGFPVLFVDSFSDITEELLNQNDHLFQESLLMDLEKLDLDKIFEEIKKTQIDND